MRKPSRRERDTHLVGVAMWRRIADEVRLDIVGGKLASGDRLPGEMELAERFGVNRHTVRHALSALQDEGIVRSEQGRGTFVTKSERQTYRSGNRIGVTEGAAGSARKSKGTVIESAVEAASATLAKTLKLKAGDPVVRLEIMTSLEDEPLSRGTSWFAEARVPAIAAAFEKRGTLAAALKTAGAGDVSRASTRISARHASPEEAKALKLAPGAILLVSETVEADANGSPVAYGLTRYAAERTDLVV